MTKRARNLLLGFVVAMIIGVSILGFAAWNLYSFFTQLPLASREVPEQIEQAGVITKNIHLTKTEIFKLDSPSILRTIADASTIKDPKQRQRVTQAQVARGIYGFSDLRVMGEEIIAAGVFGAFILDIDGGLKRAILFEPVESRVKIGPFETTNYDSIYPPQIVTLENGRFGFLTFGSVNGARIFDSNGDLKWSYGGTGIDLGILVEGDKERQNSSDTEKYVLNAAVVDVDGDGQSEYIVGVINDGIHAFDQTGTERWFQPDDFPSGKIFVADINNNGSVELVTDEDVRDELGNVIGKIEADGELVIGDKQDDDRAIMFCDIDRLATTCTDSKGNTKFSATAPLSTVTSAQTQATKLPSSTPVDLGNGMRAEPVEGPFPQSTDDETVYRPLAAWVKLSDKEKSYLAVLAPFIGIPRTNLYIYDQTGVLVYHELLDEEAETIAVVRSSRNKEQLLVGGKSTIWRYDVD